MKFAPAKQEINAKIEFFSYKTDAYFEYLNVVSKIIWLQCEYFYKEFIKVKIHFFDSS